MNFEDILRFQLVVDEGVRAKPYKDTNDRVSIGIGRNLTDVGLSNDEIDLLYKNDAAKAIAAAKALFPTFDKLTEVRKAVLCNMAFNLGKGGLSSFQTLNKAITSGDYELAANSMLSSLWAKQVGKRAIRLAEQMRKG